MKLFHRYREVEKKTNQILNVDWNIMSGGFCLLGRDSWTFLHRFWTGGNPQLGEETEFIIRGQIAIERVRRFSWLTFELFNLFEARPFILLVTVWPMHTLVVCCNIGWRLTRASRENLDRQAMDHERRNIQAMRDRIAKVKQGVQLKEA